MPILFNPKREAFCHKIVEGMSPPEAAKFIGIGEVTGRRWMHRQEVADRIIELNKQVINRAVIQRSDVITGIKDNIDLAKISGQHQAAINGWKLLGSELHGMFVERKEIGGPGDFENKSVEELRAYIFNEMKALGMVPEEPPLIEHQPLPSKPETTE